MGVIVGPEYVDKDSFGNYAVGAQISELIWQVPAAVSIIFFSESMSVKGHDIDWAKKIAKTCRVQFLITSVFCLVGVVFCEAVLPYLIGQDFDRIYIILLILTPGIALMSVFKVINVDFAGRGKPWVSLYFTPVLCVGSYYLSISNAEKYGLLGLVFSISLTYCLGALIITLVYSRKYNVSFFDFFLIKKCDFKIR